MGQQGVDMKTFLCIMLFFNPLMLLAAEHGVFMVVKGSVKIEGSGAPTEAKVGSKIHEGETVITGPDSRAKIVMTDRNIINISPNTQLKIEKYSNTSKDKNVRLTLVEGKVRNNVEQKYDNKNSKFEVRTATAVAGVRGTQFITSYNSSTRVTEVITLKGQVSFASLTAAASSSAASNEVVVGRGEKSEVQEGSGASAPAKVPVQEIRQIETDTNVKKDSAKSEVKTDTPVVAGPSPTTTAPLKDLTRDNNQLIDGATNRKFDKSKIRIITQPDGN